MSDIKDGDNDGEEYSNDTSSDNDGDEGVTIPEEFQKHVHGVMQKATTKHHVAHIRSKLNEKEDEIRAKEHEEQAKKMKGKQKEFSTSGMPAVY